TATPTTGQPPPPDLARPAPGLVRGSATRQPAALARHTEGGIWERLEPRLGDGLTTAFTGAIGAGIDAFEGPVDLLHRPPCLGAERKIALALDVDGGALARLLVELDVAWFHLLGQLLGLGPQRLRLAHIALALGD